jgi:hypothetical protein
MPQEASISKVEPISPSHDLSRFDCGIHESLNDWLKRFALTNQKNESARTYVVHRNGSVVGYYSVSAGSVSLEEAPARIAKGLARHQSQSSCWPGSLLIERDSVRASAKALLRTHSRIAQAAEIVGARAVLVHAIDERARTFYEHFDFEPSPIHELQLMLLMKDLRKAMEE